MGEGAPQIQGPISSSLTPTANAGPALIGDHRSVAHTSPSPPHTHTNTLIDPGACHCLYLVPNTFAVPLISNKN